jgi:hypothetical protein
MFQFSSLLDPEPEGGLQATGSCAPVVSKHARAVLGLLPGTHFNSVLYYHSTSKVSERSGL